MLKEMIWVKQIKSPCIPDLKENNKDKKGMKNNSSSNIGIAVIFMFLPIFF